MFSSLFGKRRSSPVEDDTPPIPGPKPDDGFEIVEPNARGSLYPSVSGGGGPAVAYPHPQRPAPPAPAFRNNVDQTFHYLQGVPFKLSRDLQMASNKNSVTTEVNNLLVFLTSKINMSSYDYEFGVEKSVLKEC